MQQVIDRDWHKELNRQDPLDTLINLLASCKMELKA